MKNLKNFISKLLIIIIVNIFVLELACFTLIKTNFVPGGLTPMVAFIADENFAVSRKKDTKFNFSSKCWDSEVYYNNQGIRSLYDIKLLKEKKRIVLLGDSMTENYQLSDGYDLASTLQKKIGNDEYEVINFGFSSTGIAEHIKLYEKKIKKLKPDILIYFPDTTDISDNHYLRKRPNQEMYKLENNIPFKLETNLSFWNSYNSTYNKIKREYGYYLKKYSNFYKLYWAINEAIYVNKIEKRNANLEPTRVDTEYYLEQKIIYEYLANILKESIDRDVTKFIVIKTLKSTDMDYFRIQDQLFNDKNNFFKTVWSSEDYYDPMISAIEYLKIKDLYNHPYLSFVCDSHYNKEGAIFYSKFISEKIIN